MRVEAVEHATRCFCSNDAQSVVLVWAEVEEGKRRRKRAVASRIRITR